MNVVADYMLVQGHVEKIVCKVISCKVIATWFVTIFDTGKCSH